MSRSPIRSWPCLRPAQVRLQLEHEACSSSAASAISSYTLRSGRSGRPLARHQARFFQPAQGDLDLPGVHCIPERAERLRQPGPQLVAMRRLLRQQRQHHFLIRRRPYTGPPGPPGPADGLRPGAGS